MKSIIRGYFICIHLSNVFTLLKFISETKSPYSETSDKKTLPYSETRQLKIYPHMTENCNLDLMTGVLSSQSDMTNFTA